MPPPDNGNEFIPFTQLMALEKLDATTFRSKALAFGPANGRRAYGGHVYSQACYAAAQTVTRDFLLHNVTGWFMIAGMTNEKFIYRVRKIRDGGFSTRGVDVFQESHPGCCFTCVCSFKRPEKASSRNLDVRQQLNLRKQYGVALGKLRPNQHPAMPGIDAPWYRDYSRKYDFNDPFPGLNLRKVDMEPYNKEIEPLKRRSLKFFSVLGDMPSVEQDPNLHVCAHLYASDRNSLFVISNHLDVGNDYGAIASLAITVIFHADSEELSMTDPEDGKARWFCQESWTGGSRQGRGLEQTRIWRDDGLHLASTMQDGLVRLKTEGTHGKEGFSSDGMIQQMEKLRKDPSKL